MSSRGLEGIAIIGMAGRFPKARNVDEFWRNLCAGDEGISTWTDDPPAANAGPNYVRARGLLQDADKFDAAFFGVKPKEAEIMDPQHRIFLECAWEALEHAGYDSAKCDDAIGVFAGMSMNTYLPANLATHPELVQMVGDYQLMLGNDKDFLPTRTSYKLNLKGPSLNIQTACSTSLVAVCVACQHLLNHQCDMALAGAVSISFPQKKGYLFQEGGIASPDGHCRAFDAQAAGTVPGEGVGIVVLKRLEDAAADGDQIYAVIKGFATNNDGSVKIGYTAPSVEGQAEVIALAQAMADVDPRSISYIEAHGTGTPLGDPIEVEGLTRAFRAGTDAKNFCALGSVKASIGHLDVAAGVVGLIKTALALHHQKLPPSLHFQAPNPKIDFAGSPFYVNQGLADWKSGSTPRRAGVSSFGIGGTNAHVVLEEAPQMQAAVASRPVQLLLLSAKTEAALERATAQLAEHLRQHPQVNLPDVAFTLQLGRRDFPHRRLVVSRNTSDAVQAIAASDPHRVVTGTVAGENRPVVFMFPGQGAQQVNMGLELYQTEPVFREEVDRCSELLKPHLGIDLRTVLYPAAGMLEPARQQLNQTAITQPALFVIEYALAMLWLSWGVEPEAMIGHSLGEYVAACLAGVFPLDTALMLIAARGRMMQQLPAGNMLAVRLPETEARLHLNGEISLAAVNGASMCVLSGPVQAVDAVRAELDRRHVPCTLLQTSHAFHSAMMEPILKPFGELVANVELKEPKIPFISNVTGTWITAAEATDPGYWARHLRHTVRFADGLGELFQQPERVVLEVGPGHTLASLARQHPARNPKSSALASMSHAKTTASDNESLMSALGQLWLAGASVNWRGFYAREKRRRVPLPTYPFERTRYWVEPGVSATVGHTAAMPASLVEPDETAESPATRAESAAPLSRRDRLISSLRELISQLSGLNLADMQAKTTFTEMGFESLFLTQVSLAIGKKFGVPVAFRQLLEGLSSLDALAGHLEKSLPPEKMAEPVATQPAPEAAPVTPAKPAAPVKLPLTEAQREIWFASQMGDAASCAYSECRLLHLHGAVHVDALRAAFQQLVARHEALRVTFTRTGDFQCIQPGLKLDLPILDWSNLPAGERIQKLDAFQKREAAEPFDFVNGPLIRARLIQLDKDRFILLLTVHHIICDGHSLGIVLRELGRLYSAECRGVPATLPPALQLGEYVAAHQKQSSRAAASEAWWLKQFSDGAPVLELPLDHPRPVSWNFCGASARVMLPTALFTSLQRLGTARGSTLFTTMLAAWVLLLRRLTGQRDIVLGIPSADRAMERGGTLVGHCINFLPLRAMVDDTAFDAHLNAVQKLFLDAHENQHCTFGSLIQKMNLPRDPGRMPLVSVTFNVERMAGDLDFGGLKAELEVNPHSLTNFDLSFNATEIQGALQVDCRYNTALFEAATIERWLGHFQTLLEGIVQSPQQSTDTLPVLSAVERRQILNEWNDTRSDYPREKCLHTLVTEQATHTPDAIAIVDGGRRLTYREIDQRANALSAKLAALGAKPESLVGVCVERSAEMVIALLAILKAGAGYVPMDPNYPKDRIAFMLEDTQAPVLISQRRLLADLPPHRATVICLDDFDWQQNSAPPAFHVQSSNLAYVIYTSGSTGKPKGVAIEHRSAVNLICWAQDVFAPQELAGVLFSTSICFDLSVFEMFLPLATGGKIILAQNALELPALAAKNEVTLINTVPSAIAELARLNAIPSSVLAVCLAGEPLKAALADRLYALGTIRHVYDLYGPSETTTYSTSALRQSGAPATIGRPIANTGLYILDAGLQPVPIGVIGEVFIGGDGLARGYLNRPELTTEKFIRHPFSDRPDARLYRTGDLARWYPNGDIEFLGRSDHQVKIRGYRVELGEIESLLMQQPGVRECAVLAREDTPGEKRLVAYVAQEPDRAAATAAELRHGLEQKLPEYMVPSAIVFLDALPLTPNGKVNRKVLPPPDQTHSDSTTPFVPPGRQTEEILIQIWRDVLGAPRIGVYDNFFELGGHSLLATQVVSRIRDTFLLELPLRCIFETPTVAGLASTVEKMLIDEIKGLSEEEARRVVNSAS